MIYRCLTTILIGFALSQSTYLFAQSDGTSSSPTKPLCNSDSPPENSSQQDKATVTTPSTTPAGNDGLPDVIAKQVGIDPIPGSLFVNLYKNDNPDASAVNVITQVSIAASDQVGYVFRVDVLKDLPAPNDYEMHIHFDLDNDPSTGRQAPAGFKGDDLAVHYEKDDSAYLTYPGGVAKDRCSGKPHIVVGKRTVYYLLNIGLSRDGNTAKFRYWVTFNTPYPPTKEGSHIWAPPVNKLTDAQITFPNTTSPDLKAPVDLAKRVYHVE